MYSKKDREMAIEGLMEIAATRQCNGAWPRWLSDSPQWASGDAVRALMRKSYLAISDDDFEFSGADRYAAAASLLRDGWTPE